MDIPEVFLIEDNPADVLLTREALSKYPIPLKIRVAKDGEQALVTLSASDCKPNLIILDLNMPKIDGHTVLERYKNKNVPVVIFSSGWNEAEVRRALALGARVFQLGQRLRTADALQALWRRGRHIQHRIDAARMQREDRRDEGLFALCVVQYFLST